MGKLVNYVQLPFHFKIPHGIWVNEICSISIDDKDNVYCLSRGNIPVLVFNKEGKLLKYWGNDTPFAGYTTYQTNIWGECLLWKGTYFAMPHGLSIDENQHLWIVDRNANAIYKYTKSGYPLVMIIPDAYEIVKVIKDVNKIKTMRGKIYKSNGKNSGLPFSYPCKAIVSKRKNGNIFISDGYANCSIHVFNKHNYQYLYSWGACGNKNGMFKLPHDICINYGNDNQNGINDTLIVADRENSRIQIFDLQGNFIYKWSIFRPCGMELSYFNKEYPKALFISQLAPSSVAKEGHNFKQLKHNQGNCVSIRDINTGKELKRIGSLTPSEDTNGFLYPHTIAVDSYGDIYTGNVAYHLVKPYRNPYVFTLITLRKLKRK